MTEDGTSDGPSSIPAEAYPEPLLEYRVAGDEPIIVDCNEAFRTAFGELPAGTSMTAGFDELDVVPSGADEDVASWVVRGDAFEVRVEVDAAESTDARASKRYAATVIPDPEEPAGHVAFVAKTNSATDAQSELELDHVASVVSHDLRNPLEVAKTRLRAGRETGDDEHLEHVAQAHERMERIIEDVLTLARGEDTIAPTDAVDLTNVAQNAWESVESKGATLTVDSRLPTAVVDPDRTGRLFANLFRNAVEHGATGAQNATDDAAQRNGDPSIRIGRIDGEETDGFYVADDGPGIPPEERDAVFEPGYSTREHGTGLGLAIVDQIADAHGWTLRVESSADGGAQIEVRDL